MPVYEVTRRLPHRAELLHDIVADVEAYPSFVPRCEETRIRNEAFDEATGRRTFSATVLIAYPKLNIRESFESDVVCDKAALTVRARSGRGLMKRLDNRWKFVPVRDGQCDVVFSIDYELSNRPLQFLLSQMFDYALRKVMNAFEARARELEAQEETAADRNQA